MRREGPRRAPQQRGCGVPDERPFALIESGRHGLIISAVNARAGADGIRIGQALAEARAAIPGLITQPAEAERDRARLHALAHGSGRYGPARNVEGDDGLWIDISGVAHLFGGEAALGEDLIGRLAAAGFGARVGIADTPAAAFALARHAAPPGRDHIAIAAPGKTLTALADLPVAALRLEAQTIVLLKRLGLRRIAQLETLPRAVLARRFRDLKHKGAGRAAERAALAQAVVMRLDQALGRIADPRTPLNEPPAYIVRRAYPEMLITSDGVESACRELAEELCSVLAAAHRGARRLRFSLYRADGSVADAGIGTSRPCRTPTHLLELFRDKLTALDVGFGVDMITLEAGQVEALSAAQTHFTAHGGDGAAAGAGHHAALVDRLVNRLGRGDVYRLEGVASHIPERAQRRVAAVSSDGAGSDGAWQTVETGRRRRPPFLFSPPEPISVIAEVPEGPPARFTWRRVTHRIVKSQGPERIAPEWWRWIGKPAARADDQDLAMAARIRDYYELEDDSGARYWVFRAGLYQHAAADGQPAWFMHGLFG